MCALGCSHFPAAAHRVASAARSLCFSILGYIQTCNDRVVLIAGVKLIARTAGGIHFNSMEPSTACSAPKADKQSRAVNVISRASWRQKFRVTYSELLLIAGELFGDFGQQPWLEFG